MKLRDAAFTACGPDESGSTGRRSYFGALSFSRTEVMLPERSRMNAISVFMGCAVGLVGWVLGLVGVLETFRRMRKGTRWKHVVPEERDYKSLLHIVKIG